MFSVFAMRFVVLSKQPEPLWCSILLGRDFLHPCVKRMSTQPLDGDNTVQGQQGFKLVVEPDLLNVWGRSRRGPEVEPAVFDFLLRHAT